MVALTCFFLSLLRATPGYTNELKTNALTGSSYTIFVYNSEIGSTSISFDEDLLFTLAAHEGVGLYVPIGTVFIAGYWAPNFDETSDLFLLFNGFALADYIIGWGLSFPNYQLQGAFFFFGHADL
jgi:hypothetical protein